MKYPAYTSEVLQPPLLQSMLEGMTDLVAALDMQFCFLAFNQAYQEEFEKIFGKKLAIGDSLVEALVHLPHEQANAVEAWGRALRGEAYSVTVPFGCLPGEPKTYEIAFHPLRDAQDRQFGAMHVARDVTERVITEQELSKTQERFKGIFENTFQFTGLLDPDGRLLEVNQTALDFSGTEKEAVLGCLFWECPWWPDAEIAERIRKAVSMASGGKTVRFETLGLAASGERAPVDFSIKPILDGNGKVSHLIPEGRLIVEQTRVREELEEMFRTTFEKATVGIGHVGADGHWLRLNRTYCDLLGYTHDELMGKTFQDITHPEDLDKDLALYDQLKHREIATYSMEKRYIRKDGSVVWVLLSASIAWGPNDEFKYAIAVVRDITASKQLEDNLKLLLLRQKIIARLGQRALSGTRLPRLMEQATMLLCKGLNADICAVLKTDDGFFKLEAGCGLAPENHDHRIGPVEANSLSGYTMLVDETVTVDDFSREIRFKPMEIFTNLNAASGMSTVIYGQNHEAPYGVLSVYSRQPREHGPDEVNFLQSVANILATAIERRNNEQKLRRFNKVLEARVNERTAQLESISLQKSRILAQVSHDFKTPLAAISRFAEILEKDGSNLTPEQRELIAYIAEGSRQMRSMVVDILDRARIEAGQVHPVPENVDIEKLVHAILPPIKVLGADRHISIHTDIEPGLSMETDPVLLRQILLNLLSNAVKYNRREGQVYVRAYRHPEKQVAVFEIEDTGMGIASDKLPGLFTDFYRVGSGMNTIEGTGLGLASARQLVEAQHGWIDVRSEPGKGSFFTVKFPLPDSEPSPC